MLRRALHSLYFLSRHLSPFPPLQLRFNPLLGLLFSSRALLWLALLTVGLLGWESAGAQVVQPADGDAASLAEMSAHLEQAFAEQADTVDFLVIFDEQHDAKAFLSAADLHATGRELRAQTLYTHLTEQAATSQSRVRAWLDDEGVAYRAFWVVNAIQVRGTALDAANLRRFPEVDRLVANPQIFHAHLASDAQPLNTLGKRVDNSADKLENTRITQGALPYGLADTNAPAVWALGHRGEGIVLASQDTGVDWNHPALRDTYRGWAPSDSDDTDDDFIDNIDSGVTSGANSSADDAVNALEDGTVDHSYNWFDAWDTQGRPARCADDAQIPCDDNGHGTHTVGTMLGRDAEADNVDGLGMAPEAEWIGCRNMLNNVGTPASYTACFEFFLAPYPAGGDPFEDGRPELAPHIVNNSWACPPSEGCDADSLRQVVETVRAAGIFVATSTGNSGGIGCGSVNNPIAIYDAAFSVGAHDENGTIALFSSRGPVIVDGSNRAKPDLSAPGVRVYSAYVRDPNALPGTPQREGYASLNGTSMASPHVAGAVALLWSAVPSLIGDIERTEQLLLKSAVPAAPPIASNPDNNCTQPGEDGLIPVPNNTYGFGRLDVLAAVEMALNPASVDVIVRDENGDVQAGEIAILIDQITNYELVGQTDEAGRAVFDAVYAGSYRVSVDNLLRADLTLVNVEPGATVEANVTLDEAVQPIYLPLVLE